MSYNKYIEKQKKMKEFTKTYSYYYNKYMEKQNETSN